MLKKLENVNRKEKGIWNDECRKVENGENKMFRR